MYSALIKYKNPVEYSFWIWMNHYPESEHPTDQDFFLIFTKNVCIFNAKKWQDTEYLEKCILKIRPNCDKEWLEQKLITYENLIAFYKIDPYPKSWSGETTNEKIPKDHYIERGYKDNKIYEKLIKRKN